MKKSNLRGSSRKVVVYGFFAFLISLAFLPAEVLAQSLLWSTDRLLNEQGDRDASNPQIAMSGTAAVAVWQQYVGDMGWSNIFSNFSADGGASWQSAKMIGSRADYNAYAPQVAISGNRVVAVWSWYPFGTDHSFIGSSFSKDGGATWHSPKMIGGWGGHSALNPHVAISGKAVIVVWRQLQGGVHRIFFNYSGDGGATWRSPSPLEHNIGRDAYNPQVAIFGSNVVALWAQFDGARMRIYSNFSRNGGMTWHTPRHLEHIGGYIPDDSAYGVAIFGTNAVAAWSQQDGTSYRIYSNYSSDGGASWHEPQLVEDNAGCQGRLPKIAISGSNAVAVWTSWDSDYDHISANSSVDGGATWHSDQSIEAPTGYSSAEPQIAVEGNKAVAVWFQFDGTRSHVYSSYSTDGGAIWSAAEVIEDNGLWFGTSPQTQVAILGDKVIAVWRHMFGAWYYIYTNNANFLPAFSYKR